MMRKASSAILNRTIPRKCYFRFSNNTSVETTSNDNIETEEISVPYRIHRGPTDILKALSSTVKKDYTAPHYKYEDDPYLIPISNVSKRSFALSKEAGRKAAHYFIEKHPRLFRVHKSDPFIKAFDPPVKYTAKDEVTEDTLKSCIESREVKNCLTIYKLLKERNLPCSKSIQQNLLELLCFYNSEQLPRDDYCEERWFGLKERPKNTWKNNGEAEILFQEMEKDGPAYAAMIQGTAKYLNVEKAVSLYEEMCEKGFQGTLSTYNGLLAIVPYIKQDGDMRWQYAMNLVQKMNEADLYPNISTMNALLNIVSKSRRWNKSKSITTQILGEMKRLNIEPSLGSYYHVLNVFCLNSKDHNDSLHQVLARIEGKDFTIEHPDDILFFSVAMEICNKVYASKGMGYKINELLEHSKNSSLMGNALNESIYYRHFLLLLCGTEDFDKFMDIYEKYVPNTYTPEPTVMLEIIKTIEFGGYYEYLPKICSDVLLFEQTEREEVFGELMRVAAGAKLEDKYQEMIICTVWEIVEKLDIRAEKQLLRRFHWTGQLLNDVLWIFLKGKELEKVWYIMKKLIEQFESITGSPTPECLIQTCVSFLRANELNKAKLCIKYALQCDHATSMKDDLIKCVNEVIEKEKLGDDLRENLHLILRSISDGPLANEDPKTLEQNIL